MSITVSKNDTHFESILASFLDETSVELSDFQKKMKERIKASFTLMLNWHSRQQAAQVLMDQFDISQATAYRDIAMALRIYGDVTKASKEGNRYLLFEYNHKLLQLATKEKNLEVMGKCLDRMMKLSELDKDESLVNLEKLAAMDIEVKISKSSEKALQEMIAKGVTDLNSFEIEDAEYEDIEVEELKGEADEA